MRFLLSIVTLLLSLTTHAKTFKVAVIDTGISSKIKHEIPLCLHGHKDFTGEGLEDTNGHGTVVSWAIHKHAQDSDYCQIIIKYYLKEKNGANNLRRSNQALEYLNNMYDVDLINYSGGGEITDKSETHLVKNLLDRGVIFVVAAGNKGDNLDKNCNYFPACADRRVVVVGNGLSEFDRKPTSSFGTWVDKWIPGRVRDPITNISTTGTSLSAALLSGMIVGKVAPILDKSSFNYYQEPANPKKPQVNLPPSIVEPEPEYSPLELAISYVVLGMFAFVALCAIAFFTYGVVIIVWSIIQSIEDFFRR